MNLKISCVVLTFFVSSAVWADGHSGGETEPAPLDQVENSAPQAEAVEEIQDGIFVTYPEMRVTLDRLMMSREVSALMLRFGAGDEMTPEELSDLQTRVRSIYPVDFETVEIIRRETLENGWRQELLVYSQGVNFIYAYVLLNQRDEDIVAVNFRFNSQFHTLNDLF